MRGCSSRTGWDRGCTSARHALRHPRGGKRRRCHHGVALDLTRRDAIQLHSQPLFLEFVSKRRDRCVPSVDLVREEELRGVEETHHSERGVLVELFAFGQLLDLSTYRVERHDVA